MPRIPIDKIYMQIAYQTAKLSYAERRKVGCIIIKDEQIVSFGYNGTPKGFDNCCEENDCTLPSVLHAESNAITKIAKSTMSSNGATLYTTTAPCFDCAKLIIQAGIEEVYYSESYRDMSGVELLKEAGISVEEVICWNDQ
jgi:dCMP deaminase